MARQRAGVASRATRAEATLTTIAFRPTLESYFFLRIFPRKDAKRVLNPSRFKLSSISAFSLKEAVDESFEDGTNGMCDTFGVLMALLEKMLLATPKAQTFPIDAHKIVTSTTSVDIPVCFRFIILESTCVPGAAKKE